MIKIFTRFFIYLITPSFYSGRFGVLLLFFSLSANAQSVKIYAVKDTIELWDKKYRSEIYWGFYKIDMDKKTIQGKGFAFRAGDKAPELTNVNHLFKDEPKDYFVILSETKIKVKRVKSTRIKRAWNDFATPGRTGGSPAETFFIIRDTLHRKDGNFKFTFNRELTEKYKREQKN